MCLYPRLIKNRKYIPNQKNGGIVPAYKDPRTLWVSVGCGKCIECKKQKAQAWRVRMHEELKVNKYKYFVTLTFSNENLNELCNELKTEECNAVATLAVRRFLERWRKYHKVSLRHWFITELGHEGTERIHLHGVIFNEKPIDEEKLNYFWRYGIVDIGEYCNERTINYIVKYVTKVDFEHKGYEPIILCSAGLGANYTKNEKAKSKYIYEKGKTKEYYTLQNGLKVSLPIYYRNKFFSEEEREQMWCDRMNKHEIFVRGIKVTNIDTEQGRIEYTKLLQEQQRINEELGYGNLSKEWKKRVYNATLKKINSIK